MTLDDSCGGLDLGPAHPNARLAKELAHSDLRLPRACIPKGGERRALPSFWREVPRHGGEDTKGPKLGSSDGGGGRTLFVRE